MSSDNKFRTTASAERLAEALCGKRTGSIWMARCPAHKDGTPSLSIRETVCGKVLVHCHAGCDQRDVIASLRSRGAWANGRTGDRHLRMVHCADPSRTEASPVKRADAALTLWRSSQRGAETLVSTYLRSRSLSIIPPPALRFHPKLRHPSHSFWPTMVALVTHGVNGKPIGIHRTFLAHDGRGKAPVEPAKMMLGPCRGGAVRLAPAAEPLMVGEGIETCLAVMQATGHAAWAALSTSGLRAVDLPPNVRDIIVLADGDDPGEAAAQACAWRWKREGRRVRVARPPKGSDFNDLLKARAPLSEERA